VAIDSRIVNEGGELHRVIQPVELPAGWAPQGPMPAGFAAMPAALAASAPHLDSPMMGRQRFSRQTGGGSMPKQRLTRRGSVAPAAQGMVANVGETALVAARTQAADEARRLEQPAGSELERREALDDLATRLEALVRHLESRGVDPGPLRSIIELLRDDTISPADRWDRARRHLTEFAGAGTSAQRAFWKRS
jgi:Ca-activated chloride channel family protein